MIRRSDGMDPNQEEPDERGLVIQALVDVGVTTCFANPGTSEMQLVYEIGMTDAVRPVLCLQEDVVTGAADGYGR